MLSIIIVNYKTSDDLDICLNSIKKSEPSFKKFEIIIVDNNSNDTGLEKIKKKYNFVKIIYASKNGGFAYGNNIGIKAAKGDVIFLLNPDTFVKDNSINKLYDKLRNSNYSFIGPNVLYPDERNQSYFTPKSYLTTWKLFCEKLYLYRILKKIKKFNSYYQTYMNYNKERDVEEIAGSAFMFKKEVLNIIGFLDENYFMYFEESDYCYQAVKHKLKLLYYPEAKIYHVGGLISESNWQRSTRDYTFSFKYYFKKNFSILSYYMANCLFFLGSFLRFILLLFIKNKKYKYYYYYMKYIIKL